MRDFVQLALDAASSEGVDYADVRAVETTTESLTVRGPTVEGLDRSSSVGFGVRVLTTGAWGYAASSRLDANEATRVASAAVEVARASATAVSKAVELVPEPVHHDSWSTPVEIDPFSVALEDKVALLTESTEEMERVPSVKFGKGTMDLLRQRSWFASSEG